MEQSDQTTAIFFIRDTLSFEPQTSSEVLLKENTAGQDDVDSAKELIEFFTTTT